MPGPRPALCTFPKDFLQEAQGSATAAQGTSGHQAQSASSDQAAGGRSRQDACQEIKQFSALAGSLRSARVSRSGRGQGRPGQSGER